MLPGPRHHDVEEVARQLSESRNPIIITEYAGRSPNAVGKLVELAELLKIPVFESMYPNVTNFPKNHPLHMGYDPMEALKEADTVFVVGATTPWYPPSAIPQNGPPKVIILDEDPLKELLPYWGYPTETHLTAEIGQCLADLVEALRARIQKSGQVDSHHKGRFERCQTAHDQIVEQWKAEASAGQESRPISPKWFLYTLNKFIPDNAIVVEETITHRRLVHRYMTAPESVVRPGVGGLGVGLGVAAGRKLAHPERPVIFLVGDGSFNYNPVVSGLGLCQEYRLPVLIIVLNNGGYLAMKGSHRRIYPEGASVSSDTFFGVDIAPDPEYAKLAEAFGGYGARLEEPDDIEPALNKAFEQFAAGRSGLLDVVLDPKI
jgi:acetolactate synthase-1/2/3 large subunit